MFCTYVAVLKCCTVKAKVPKIKVEQNIQSTIEKCERSSLIRFLVLKSLYFWGHSIHNAMMMLLVALKIIYCSASCENSTAAAVVYIYM